MGSKGLRAAQNYYVIFTAIEVNGDQQKSSLTPFFFLFAQLFSNRSEQVSLENLLSCWEFHFMLFLLASLCLNSAFPAQSSNLFCLHLHVCKQLLVLEWLRSRLLDYCGCALDQIDWTIYEGTLTLQPPYLLTYKMEIEVEFFIQS